MSIMKDGLHTIILMGGLDNQGGGGITFAEKRLKPPGYDGGGKIDTTSLRNQFMRTSWTKSLRTITDMTAVVEWDPRLYDDIQTDIQKIIQWLIQFPDGETISFWGSLDKFDPNDHVEGEQPTANITVIIHGINGSEAEEDLIFAEL